jgi:hypothetical protein
MPESFDDFRDSGFEVRHGAAHLALTEAILPRAPRADNSLLQQRAMNVPCATLA